MQTAQSALISTFPHTCYLYSLDQQVNFDAGSEEFTVGGEVTGAESGASGTVKSVTLSTGTWTGGDAAGYLVLSNVDGTFQDDEIITGNVAGIAVTDGENEDYANSYGKKTQTVGTTEIPCQFRNQASPPSSKVDYGWSGRFPAVLLPAGTDLYEGQQIYSTMPSHEGVFLVQWPPIYYPDESGDIYYIICGLQDVTPSE